MYVSQLCDLFLANKLRTDISKKCGKGLVSKRREIITCVWCSCMYVWCNENGDEDDQDEQKDD